MEQHHAVADQLGHRLAPGRAQEQRKARDLAVAQPFGAVLAGQLGLAQPGDDVVGRVAALLVDEREEVLMLHHPRLDARRRRRRIIRLAVEESVGAQADSLPVGRRHAEHRRDHLDRERRGEVGHRVELRPPAHRVQRRADDVADHRLERRDRTRREHPADEIAHAARARVGRGR